MNSTTNKLNSKQAIVAVLFSLTLFFFGPAQIFFNNRDDFPFPISRTLMLLAVIAITAAVVITLLLRILPASLSARALGAILASASLLWLQGNILVWNYGILDGRDIDWKSNILRQLIDTPLWIALIVAGILLSSLAKRLAHPLSLALIIIQSISLIMTFMLNNNSLPSQNFTVSGHQKFAFSRTRNIIIIVLDMFSTDIFQELLLENPDYQNTFAGFTYFRNTLGGTPTTRTAIPVILTGQAFKNKIPLPDFYKSVYTTASLPQYLKKMGYRCDIFPPGNYSIYLDSSLASNLTLDNQISKEKTAFLIDLSLFRQAPHFIKKLIFNRQNWFLSNWMKKAATREPKFMPTGKKLDPQLKGKPQSIIIAGERRADDDQEMRTDTDRPVFKFFYHLGIHPPLMVHKAGNLVHLSFTRDNMKIQAIEEINSIKHFLGKLKLVNAFTNSLIFIAGDHGPGNAGIRNIGDCLPGSKAKPLSGKHKLIKIITSALPMLLVKPMGITAGRPLAISDAPACLGDIPCTAAASTGSKSAFPGRSLFTISPNESRKRIYLYYEGVKTSSRGFYKAIWEYRVRGLGWLESSWKPTGRVFLPQQ